MPLGANSHSPEVIQSLWIGNRLSTMEQLCVQSFLTLGYEFHLYAYETIANVPFGTRLCSAEEVIPAAEVFVYRHGSDRGNPSAFSNLFRYKLLYERGGWWADLDAALLQPFNFAEEHVFGLERTPGGQTHVGTGLWKSPLGSPLVKYCYDVCQRVNRQELRWGQIGPQLMREAIAAVNVRPRLLDPPCFYPVNYWQIEQFTHPPRHSPSPQLADDCYSVHLWNSQWRRRALDPDWQYDPECLYEKLIRRFLPAGSVDEPAPAQQVGAHRPSLLEIGKRTVRTMRQWWAGELRSRRPMRTLRKTA